MKNETAIPQLKNFSLLETVVLLAIVAVVVAAMVPGTIKFVTTKKISDAKQEMEMIFKSITGDPERNTYGFLGDLGIFPKEMTDLIQPNLYPLYHTDTFYELGMGWNGPYIIKTASDVRMDPFGREYRLQEKEGRFRIESAGPDREYDTRDDLVYPALPFEAYGTARLELNRSGDYLVRLYYSDAGEERFLQTDRAPYLFKGLHRGPHAVEILVPTGDEYLTVARTLIILTEQSGIFQIEF